MQHGEVSGSFHSLKRKLKGEVLQNNVGNAISSVGKVIKINMTFCKSRKAEERGWKLNANTYQ
jgi:hypothetical protein